MAALLVVIVLGASALLIAVGVSLLGLGELDMGYVSARGGETLSIADGCVEETMRRMRIDTDYGVGAGTISLSMGTGSCIIDVTDFGAGLRRIIAQSTTASYYKRIQVDLTLSGNVITVTSWSELSS